MSSQLKVLVVGTPRSGTTLLQRLLVESLGILIPPETHLFTRHFRALLAACGSGDSSSLHQLLVQMRSNSLPDLNEGRVHALLPGGRRPSPIEVLRAIVASQCEAGSEPRPLGEKTPGHLPYVGYLLEADPELRAIAIVRDPRAVVASQLRVPWGAVSSDLAAGRWSFDQRALRRIRRTHESRLLTVSYEAMVSSSDEVMWEVRSFLGTARSDSRTNRLGRRTPLFLEEETWKELSVGRVDGARAGAWSDELSRFDCAVVEAACAGEMRRFGYEPSRTPGRSIMPRSRIRAAIEQQRRADRIRKRLHALHLLNGMSRTEVRDV